MIQIQFSPEEIDTLRYEKTHHPQVLVRQRMEALYLKSQELPHQEICRHVGITRATLARYLKSYQAGGLEALRQERQYAPSSDLDEWAIVLKDHFKAEPPRTVGEAQEAIRRLTGLSRSPTQVRAFLRRLGLSWRKVGALPKKASDPAHRQVQEEFKKKALEPRLEEARQGQRLVFFVDAVHFVFGAFLGMVWCWTRLFLPTPAGRQRLNVLGALNAVTHEVVTVINETYINSLSVCWLLEKLAALAQGVPVTVVLDNARYQRCALVQKTAAALGIELLFLPAYSPQLNLIERLWKFVKKECLYSKYYPHFGEFKKAIITCINTTHTVHKNALSSLLTWNFQSFEKVTVMAF